MAGIVHYLSLLSLASYKPSISTFNRYKTSPLCTFYPTPALPHSWSLQGQLGSEALHSRAPLRAESGRPEGGALRPSAPAPPHALAGQPTQNPERWPLTAPS